MSASHEHRAILEVRDAVKHYGNVVALDHFSLEVREGETLGLIGANGAGKSTLIESAMGARILDSGNITVRGLSPHRQRSEAVKHMSLQPQGASLYKHLTVFESVSLWNSLYPNPLTPDEVIATVGLKEKRNKRVHTLSGGQQQRLRLALALVGNTEVVLFDEPTVGLDPIVRESIWDVIRQRAGKGAVLLATQMMDEAEALCDRVVIIDHGRAVETGTVENLLRQYAHDGSISFKTSTRVSTETLRALPCVRWASARQVGDGVNVRLITADQTTTKRAITANGSFQPSMYRTASPSLSDVFLALLGSTPSPIREES